MFHEKVRNQRERAMTERRELDELAETFCALSDPTRVEILRVLAQEPSVYQKVLISKLNRRQPSISRHLAYLRQRGLVVSRRSGRYTYWELGSVSSKVIEFITSLSAAKRGSQSEMNPTAHATESILAT